MASRFTPLVRSAARRCAVVRPALVSPSSAAVRALHDGPPRRNKPGSHSQTDSDIEIPFPPEDELPSEPVRRAGGQYVKPTLQTFSLDKNVGLVTGGARGLGLVIAQGMVYSGADVALVDMNSKSPPELVHWFAQGFIFSRPVSLTHLQRRKLRSRPRTSLRGSCGRTLMLSGTFFLFSLVFFSLFFLFNK